MATGDAVDAAIVLTLAFAGESDAARERAAAVLARRQLTVDGRVAVVAATAFVDYVDARFADSLLAARRAVAVAHAASPGVRFFADAVHALALSNEPDFAVTDPGAFAEVVAGRDAVHGLPAGLQWLALAVLIEAAFANGQIAIAGLVLAERDALERPKMSGSFALLQGVRVAFFANDVALARTRCEDITAHGLDGASAKAVALNHAFLALAAAYQGDAATVERHVASALELVQTPRRWIDGGTHIVCAYALAGLGRHARARPLVLSGGGGPDLHLCQLVDRALGFDILVAAAIADHDLEAAELWARRARELAASPAAALAVEQVDARLALARGEAADAVARAALAAEQARAAGRVLEASAAELARAQAMIAEGQTTVAIGRLQSVAHDAEAAGTLVLRQRATEELRRLGRRLDPRPGAGVSALSARELEVATLAAEGFTSRHIAQSLFLSERTVQTHLRRAMRAMGVDTRVALPAALGVVMAAARSQPLATPGELTQRQRAVADLVYEGYTNAEIAAELGISVKTVEKHVGLIFERWGVSTRTGIAHVVAQRP